MHTSLFGFADTHHHGIYRLVGVSVVLGFLIVLLWLARTKQKHRLISFTIITALLALAAYIVKLLGTLNPTGILLLSLVIVLAGILWMFNHQMEASLQRARQSELALGRQNERLEAEVSERTRQLEATQLEKVQQVYRFAEMGRISSALFHELANHLTGISMEIEGLSSDNQNKLMSQVQNDIHYIDEIVQRVRMQLRGQGSVEMIDITAEIKRIAKILNYKLVKSHITLKLEPPLSPIYWRGDVIPFRQVINNLLVNAIEAYATSRRKNKMICIRILVEKPQLCIYVTDWGSGIAPELQTKVFEPFYSSKTDGTGIGLYIVKQIVEHDLHGSIGLSSNRRHGTTFTVKLMQNNQYK